jgi:hypothetical protein
MSFECRHAEHVKDVTPSALGCEDCLKAGSLGASPPVQDLWPRRLLRRLAKPTRHRAFRATGHPLIEGHDPPEGWGWCYVDEVSIELGERTTPQRGPIPKFA